MKIKYEFADGSVDEKMKICDIIHKFCLKIKIELCKTEKRKKFSQIGKGMSYLSGILDSERRAE